jgi:hypothetical protein
LGLSLQPGEWVPYSGSYLPTVCDEPSMGIVTATGTSACGVGAVTASARATCMCTSPPCGITLVKVADRTQIAPGDSVVYYYTVSNANVAPLTGVVVYDDSGTPGQTNDDFVVGTVATLGGLQSVTLTHTSTPLVTLGQEQCISSLINFTGDSPLDGMDGNIRVFATNGISVRVSAWSRIKSTGLWAPAYCGSYTYGLGVTDSSEGDGSNNRHLVDNLDRDNYVLFEFSQSVTVNRAYLGYVVGEQPPEFERRHRGQLWIWRIQCDQQRKQPAMGSVQFGRPGRKRAVDRDVAGRCVGQRRIQDHRIGCL